MPELPEVEVIRRGLLPLLQGRRIVKIICANRKLRLPVPRAALTRWVQERRIQAVDRRAKYLLIRMENNAVMVFHLGMTGRLCLFSAKAKRSKHDHIRILLDNDMELRFNDIRRFGSVQVVMHGDLQKADFFARLGPEPLGNDFSPISLYEKARHRMQPVKSFLMDSRMVAGIGNIYANEILFQAQIAPFTAVSTLDHEKWTRIVAAARDVLQQAIAVGGTTIADFVDSRGESGYFQAELKVYGREGRPCRQCGNLISRMVLAGRASYFCSHCQA